MNRTFYKTKENMAMEVPNPYATITSIVNKSLLFIC